MAAIWVEIEVEAAGDEIHVAARGSRGERPKRWSLGPSVTRERLATFARDVGRAVRAGKPLPPPVLQEAQDLRAAVFHETLRELSAHLLEASKNQPLLQRLFIPDRDLQSVPWEALCERDSSVDFWGSSDKLLIARGVTSSRPWEPREVRGAVRILAIAPYVNSSDERALLALREALGPSIDAGEVEWLDPIAGPYVSPTRLFEKLRAGKTPHVIHFLGHGGVDASQHPVLRLADDEDGEEVWIKAEALAQELSASFGGDLRLIVLEACEGAKSGVFGSAAEILSRAGADAVVAHLWPVKSDVARACSRAFYRSLTGAERDFGNVAASLGAARRSLLLQSAEGFSPVVYLRGAGSAIFRFEGRKISPPKPKSAALSKSLAPALQGLLARPFCMILGDRGEDTSTLRAELEAFLAEHGDTSFAGLSLYSLTQRCALRFGPEMLQSLFQQALVGALQRPSPTSPLLDALAKRLRPGVHVTLLWLPSLESALARHHPDRTIYVLQPGSSGSSALPRIIKRAAGASAWRASPSLPQRFDLSAELVVLRLYGGYSPEPMPILTSPLLTEDDHIRGLVAGEPSRTPEWANKLVGELRMRPGLFLHLSVLDWRHRMLLRWLYNNAPAPTDSLALLDALDAQTDPVEQDIWTGGGGLPGTGRIAALREDMGDLAAQLEALSLEEAAP